MVLKDGVIFIGIFIIMLKNAALIAEKIDRYSAYLSAARKIANNLSNKLKK